MTVHKTSRSLALMVISGLAMLGLGFGLGAATFILAEPSSLARPTPSGSVPVTTREFTDPRTSAAEIALPRSITVAAGRSGRITTMDIHPGQVIASGDAVLAVDGAMLIAMASEVPPWRDLSRGDQGADVRALQQELVRLGQRLRATGTVDAATLAAVAKLRGRPTTTIDTSGWLWIPAPTVRVSSVIASVGDQLTEASQVLVAEDEAITATVALHSDAVPGARSIAVAGARYEVGPDGALDPAAARAIMATDAFGAAQEQSPKARSLTVPVTWELTTPVTAFAVPPSAIVQRTDERRCVVADGIPVPVDLVSSELGLALVMSEVPLAAVDPTPPEDTSCG